MILANYNRIIDVFAIIWYNDDYNLIIQQVVVSMKEKRKMNPIFMRLVINFTVLLLVLLLNSFAAIFAFQIEEELNLITESEPQPEPTLEYILSGEIDETQSSIEETAAEYYSEAIKDFYVEYTEAEKEEEEWPERVVFLTFDDGPSANTSALLDILYEEDAPATFFLVGESMLTYSETRNRVLMERMLAEGHYIGLHSMTHVFSTLYLGYGAPARFVAEMMQLQELIYDVIGYRSNLCRAPYGMMSGFTPGSGHIEAVVEAGIKCIDWNVDPQDWDNDAQLSLEYLINQVERLRFPSELVIVLHELDTTVEALPAMIAFLREHGYVFKAYQPGHEFIYQQYRYRLH